MKFRRRNTLITLLTAAVLICAASSMCLSAIWYVAAEDEHNQWPTHNGAAWSTAFVSIQDALNAPTLASGDEIWVACGEYYMPDSCYCYSIPQGVKLYGGFSGTETQLSQRQLSGYMSILYGVPGSFTVTADNGSIVDGFTIHSGDEGVYAWGTAVVSHNYFDSGGDLGIGVHAEGGTVKITNNRFDGIPYGVYLDTTSAHVANNLFTNCGNGVYVIGTSGPSIVNNTFVGNLAGVKMHGDESGTPYPVVANNIIKWSTTCAIQALGACNPTISHNCLYDNDGNYCDLPTDPTGITTDPGLTSDYHIPDASPCKDAGDDTRVAATDIDMDNATRIVGSHVDIGADEVPDTTPPTTPVVTDDGLCTTSTNQLHASWSSSDATSGVASYQYAIGSTSGGTDVLDWTALTTSSVTKADLSLVVGTTYYFSVKAIDGSGNTSAVGVSDGITCVDGTVSGQASPANRGVLGTSHFTYGGYYDTDQYHQLLAKWNYGFERDSHYEDWNWESNWNSWAEYAKQWRGPTVGALGYTSIASQSDAILCWALNMHGNADLYGRAWYYNSQTQQWSQPAYDHQPGQPGASPFDVAGVWKQGAWSATETQGPTPNEKANWCTKYDANNLDNGYEYSTFKSAQDLAAHTLAKGVPSVFELGNEVYWSNSVTEGYWKTSGSQPTRVAWGSNGSSDKLGGNGGDLTLDWTTDGSVHADGNDGNVLYVGFTYKPTYFTYDVASPGTGGTANWEYLADDGTWKPLQIGGAQGADTVDSKWFFTWRDTPSTALQQIINSYPGYVPAPAVSLDRMTSFLLTNRQSDPNNPYNYPFSPFLAPVDFGVVDYPGYPGQKKLDTANRDAGATWEQNAALFNQGWCRTQPSEIGGSDVRKLYWVRVYATQKYTVAPVLHTFGRYVCDFNDYYDICSEYARAIHRGNPDAKVFTVGPQSPTNSFWSNRARYCLAKKDAQGNLVYDYDGVTIHPYVGVKIENHQTDTPKVLDLVDHVSSANDSNLGLLEIIDSTRTWLDNNCGTNKQIACTEFGANIDSKTDTLCNTVTEGLHILDSYMSMMPERTVNGHTKHIPEYASYWTNISYPGWNSSPFYCLSTCSNGVWSARIYILRPLGLTTQLLGTHYRPNVHEVELGVPKSEAKAFAFSGTWKGSSTSTMVLINKTQTAKTLVINWPDVSGKHIYLEAVKPNQAAPAFAYDANNDTVGSQQVELVPAIYGGDVSADGRVSVTVPAVGAVGLEFTDTVPSTTAPAGILDLSATPKLDLRQDTQSNNGRGVWKLGATLSWTVPSGAGAYEIRYSENQITDANWDSATHYAGVPEPTAAGLQQAFVALGLDANKTYYYAMKTRDNNGNWSGMSNCASVYIPGGNLVGQVTSSLGGPISGVSITLDTQQSTTTDSNGNYSLSDVPSGQIVVQASMANYGTVYRNPTVSDNTTTTCNIVLTPDPGTISGKVTSTAGGNLSGVTVSVSGHSATTDTEGNYTLAGIAAGPKTVTASKTGYDSSNASVVVNPDETVTCDIALAPHVPSTPTNVVAVSSDWNLTHITWTASSDSTGITSYQVYRDGACVATVAGTTTGYNDFGLSQGTTYAYQVRAKNGVDQWSALSSSYSVKTWSVLLNDPFADLSNWTASKVADGTIRGVSADANNGSSLSGGSGAPSAVSVVGSTGTNGSYSSAGYSSSFAVGYIQCSMYDSSTYNESRNHVAFRKSQDDDIARPRLVYMMGCDSSNNRGAYTCGIYDSTSNTWTKTANGGTRSVGWHQFRVGIDGTNVKFYLDGILKDTIAEPAGKGLGVNRFYIGNNFNVNAAAQYDDFVACFPTPPTPTPSAPSNVTSGSITWNFTEGPSDFEQGFYIKDTQGNIKGTVGRNITSFVETGLAPNTSYTRVISAYNGTLESPVSVTVTATTLP